ncbi:hypothetical protein CTA1_12713 [Colletotrichum tanaceti]|uniref:Uncharacterized protein n=1 Tax=Colletotrichum tanaceti TaxID=1306861 RepID=A0A4U6X7N3_9PEZI|nr:hypothetical protein CTA1_12713 [Colletotrichum tanaceti]
MEGGKMKNFLDVVETNSFDPSSWSTFLRTNADTRHRDRNLGPRGGRAYENASLSLAWLREDSPEDLGLSTSRMEDATRHNARHTMDLRVFPWYKELFYLAIEYVVVVAHTLGLGQDYYFEGVKYNPRG